MQVLGGCLGCRSSASGLLRVRQDELGAQQAGRAGGIGAELGEDPPALEMGEAVLDRGACGGEGPVASFSLVVSLRARVVLRPVTTTGSSGSSSRPRKPRSA